MESRPSVRLDAASQMPSVFEAGRCDRLFCRERKFVSAGVVMLLKIKKMKKDDDAPSRKPSSFPFPADDNLEIFPGIIVKLRPIKSHVRLLKVVCANKNEPREAGYSRLGNRENRTSSPEGRLLQRGKV